jgi:hypothetical protein
MSACIAALGSGGEHEMKQESTAAYNPQRVFHYLRRAVEIWLFTRQG